MKISLVIPVYGSPESLEELYRRCVASLQAITSEFEIILVNDACPRDSWQIIRRIALSDPRVKGVDLSRNFGQIRAITAGLEFVTGDWVVVMDCDLQDRPEEILRLYRKAQEGYDVVLARRAARKDTFLKRSASRMFYAAYGYLTGGAFDSSICNFSVSKRLVMENYRRIGDQNRAFVLFIRWMGFKTAILDIDHAERPYGRSSYTLRKQLRLACEVITTQSNKPLVLSIKIGFSVALLAFLYAAALIVRYLTHGIGVSGYTSIIVSIFFVGGVILGQLGILGLYLGYVFNQVKQRPLYIVREIVEEKTIRAPDQETLLGLGAAGHR